MYLSFENPRILWLLFLLPFLILAHFFWLKRTKRKAMKFANFIALKRVTGHNLISKQYSLLFLRLLIFFLIILSAAKPYLWYESLTNENSFVIAIDVSSSMMAEDIKPNRFIFAKKIAEDIINSIQDNTNIALITFSGVSNVIELPTINKNKLLSSLKDLKSEPASGTDIPGTIFTATNLLLNEDNGKSLILITDGSNTIEPFIAGSLKKSLDYAKENQIIINTIGIGSNLTAPIGYLPSYYNITPVYNDILLRRLANETKGVYVHAINSDSLKKFYDYLLNKNTKRIIKKPIYQELLILILLLLFFEWFFVNTFFRIIP